MDDKTGGPAYPTKNYETYVPQSTGYSEGMTLLDYFAGQAMPLCTNTDYEDAAKLCYSRAAAMIKEREKRK